MYSLSDEMYFLWFWANNGGGLGGGMPLFWLLVQFIS